MIAYTAWDSLQAIAQQYDADLVLAPGERLGLTRRRTNPPLGPPCAASASVCALDRGSASPRGRHVHDSSGDHAAIGGIRLRSRPGSSATCAPGRRTTPPRSAISSPSMRSTTRHRTQSRGAIGTESSPAGSSARTSRNLGFRYEVLAVAADLAFVRGWTHYVEPPSDSATVGHSVRCGGTLRRLYGMVDGARPAGRGDELRGNG